MAWVTRKLSKFVLTSLLRVHMSYNIIKQTLTKLKNTNINRAVLGLYEIEIIWGAELGFRNLWGTLSWHFSV